MTDDREKTPWDDFEPLRERETTSGNRLAGLVSFLLLFLFLGAVAGGLVGFFLPYRERVGRRGPNVSAMMADTNEAAQRRFMIGAAIGAGVGLVSGGGAWIRYSRGG